MRTYTNCQYGTVAGVGGVFVLIGAVFLGAWSELFDFIVRKQLILSKGSYSYKLWADVTVPVHLDFYFYNWTNPEMFYDSDPEKRKPNLVELGPYTFSEHRTKNVVAWNDNNDTVTFRQLRTWHFEPSLSAGSLDDVVTALNVPAVTAVYAVRDNSPALKGLLNTVLETLDIKLYVKKSIGELTFYGYDDILMDLSTLLPPGLIPVTIPFEKFGWFYTRNASSLYDGVFNMYTGKGDIKNFGKITSWNYENPTRVYESYCGGVNGSAGEFFSPNPTKDSISLFSTDICRTVELPFKEEIRVEGIDSYRYWMDKRAFDNLTLNADNWCFCPSGECPPHGAIDVSSCKWGAPAYISLPHFHMADPSYSKAVNGMKPDDRIHNMFVDLEHRTGIPIQVEAALQINILIRPYSEYNLFRGAPKTYFPVLWFKERAKLDGDIKSQIQLVNRMPFAGYIIFAVFICMGLATLAIAGYYYVKDRRSGSSEGDLKLVGT